MRKKKISFPKMQEINDETVQNYIGDFYRALGWDGKCNLDPKHISINSTRWMEICDDFGKTNIEGAAYTWLNWGPTTDANTPYEKVSISKGAFSPVEKVLEL